MTRFGALAALALLVLPGAARAQLYEGKAGTAPIVLELDQGDGAPSGRYFYRSTRLDIAFEGERRGDGVALNARLTGDKLALKRVGTGGTGTLPTVTAKPRRGAHPRAAAPPAPVGAPADLGDYDRLQLAGLRFEPGAIERFGPRVIRWYTERVTGIRLFRLESGYAASAQRRINAALDAAHWQHVHNWFGCPGYEGGAGIDADEANSLYLDASYVSYAWHTSWGCAGAAHPDFGMQGWIYDARSGARIGIDDLLRFGKAPPRGQSDAWYAYHREVFSPGLLALLKRHHSQEIAAAKADGCDYDDAGVWGVPEAYLTPQGLFVGAYFARAERACDEPEWAVIPWRELNGPAARRPR